MWLRLSEPARAQARQAHGDVAAQHCAVQLPQCSMVALSIFECMGVGGEGPAGSPS